MSCTQRTSKRRWTVSFWPTLFLYKRRCMYARTTSGFQVWTPCVWRKYSAEPVAWLQLWLGPIFIWSVSVLGPSHVKFKVHDTAVFIYLHIYIFIFLYIYRGIEGKSKNALSLQYARQNLLLVALNHSWHTKPDKPTIMPCALETLLRGRNPRAAPLAWRGSTVIETQTQVFRSRSLQYHNIYNTA